MLIWVIEVLAGVRHLTLSILHPSTRPKDEGLTVGNTGFSLKLFPEILSPNCYTVNTVNTVYYANTVNTVYYAYYSYNMFTAIFLYNKLSNVLFVYFELLLSLVSLCRYAKSIRHLIFQGCELSFFFLPFFFKLFACFREFLHACIFLHVFERFSQTQSFVYAMF